MGKILRVAQREYAETVRTKTFILGVLMAPVIVAGIIFFTGRISRGPSGTRPPLRVEVTDHSAQLAQEIRSAVAERNQADPDRKLVLSMLDAKNDDRKNIEARGKARLREGKTDVYAVIDPNIIAGDGQIHFYTYKPKASNLDRLGSVEHLLRTAVINRRCEVEDISAQLLSRIRRVSVVTIEVGETAGKQKVQKQSDKIMKMMVPFFFMYLMFMGMIGTGQHMISSVIEEKGSRVIEVLLSAVSPFQLMAGKIVGLAGIGLTVVGIWGSAAFAAARYKGFQVDVPPAMLVYFVLYFLPGFLLFTSLLAGVGSVCNTLKETQGLMMPIMLVFILPLLAWMKLAQEPDGLLARALSFFPPLTPMVMMLRISASEHVSAIEIGASLVVLVLGLAITMWAAAKVFRTGILMYGKRPGVREILRWVRHA